MNNQNESPITSWTPLTRWQKFKLTLPFVYSDVVIFLSAVVVLFTGAHHLLSNRVISPLVCDLCWDWPIAIALGAALIANYIGIRLKHVRTRAKDLLGFEDLFVVYWLERMNDSLKLRSSKPLVRHDVFTVIKERDGAAIAAIVSVRRGCPSKIYFPDAGNALKETVLSWKIELVCADFSFDSGYKTMVRLIDANGKSHAMSIQEALTLIHQFACESVVLLDPFSALQTTNASLAVCRAEIRDLEDQLRNASRARDDAELEFLTAVEMGTATVLKLRDKGQVGRSGVAKRIADEATVDLLRVLPETHRLAQRLTAAQAASDAYRKRHGKRASTDAQA